MNEILVLIISDCLFIFTECYSEIDDETYTANVLQFDLGWGLLALIILISITNLAINIVIVFKKARLISKRYLNRLKTWRK